ncbi:hypothetical protein L1987_00073 [Smallanthus sonchifolius]|uniref:Uncharacterized protein n=1 Tax=Smallanthus sonchifolius TaxID=185202 RepID=A0ACB9K1C0_9ASTR|nr:hypothetical protein L1987_00073 [Smallanthus sonchifolius]
MSSSFIDADHEIILRTSVQGRVITFTESFICAAFEFDDANAPHSIPRHHVEAVYACFSTKDSDCDIASLRIQEAELIIGVPFNYSYYILLLGGACHKQYVP